MQTNWERKIVVCEIILLFLATNIASNVGRNIGGTALGHHAQEGDDFNETILMYMKEAHMPSLVAYIVNNNTVLWSHAYGNYRYYQNKNTSVDIVYPIGCITKSVIATAIMQLHETRNISLDENVSKYLNFDLKNPNYKTVNITFRMLLAHQSSLANPYQRFVFYFFWLHIPMSHFRDYFVPGGCLYSDKVWNLTYPPGKGVCYCSAGYSILGYIIENISKMSLEDYCQKYIFGPLSMNNTSFYFAKFDRNRICGLYAWYAHIYLPLPIMEYGLPAPSGIKSTGEDMSHFLIMHASRGVYNGVRILSNESVDEMHDIQYQEYHDRKVQYGLGWYTYKIDNVTYGGHAGGYVGAPALMRLRYADNVGILMLWNQNTYLLQSLNIIRQDEHNAIQSIASMLFEKADEQCKDLK